MSTVPNPEANAGPTPSPNLPRVPISPGVPGTTGGDLPGMGLPADAPSGAPFVTEFRARPGTLVVGEGIPGPHWTIRVEVPEVWDVVRISAPPGVPVHAVKRSALAALMPDAEHVDDFVIKLNGGVVLDEHAPMADVGARDGSIFLVTHRRRRAVR